MMASETKTEHALSTALDYIARGWNPVPIPFKAKGPTDSAWQQRVIGAETARQFFNGRPQNVGVILGPTSQGLTDIDLDCPEAIALARYLLPETKARFGRRSKPESHWLYVTGLGEASEKAVIAFRASARETLVELRVGGASGAQTVFPGSVHESGEPVEWNSRGEPAKVDGERLRSQVAALAAASLMLRHWPAAGLKARHDCALTVGGFLARCGWSAADAAHVVGAISRVCGDPEVRDREHAAHDAADAYQRGERTRGFPAMVEVFGEEVVKRIAPWLGYRGEAERIEAPRNATTDLDELVTEDGAAQRFAAEFGGRLRFCHNAGSWLEWNGHAWRPCRTGGPFHYARVLARELARTEPDKVRYITSKTSFAAGVERYARTDPVFAVTIDHWDCDPMLLGTPAGTVDLRTGALLTSNSADGITKLTAVGPADRSGCPRWLAFLEEATGGDVELIRFLQQWAGYSLTGDTREHALVFVYGPGGNGKSVFLNALTGILGEYATTAAMDTFTASKGDKHPTDLAMLRGARLVTASETEEGRAWAESRIKQMTGGDPITARFMRQDFFTYRPQFKLTIIGNHQPVLRNVDEAARRRFNIVPFTRKPAQPDRQLEEKLKAEWPGILRWMIEGCLDWQENGLIRPTSVTGATEEYFAEQDLFGQWLADECDVEPSNPYKWTPTARLFEAWSNYARAAAEPPGSVKSFAPLMRRHGLHDKSDGKARGWQGIRLLSDVSAARD